MYLYICLFDAWISWFSSLVKSSVELDTEYCFSEELSGTHIYTCSNFNIYMYMHIGGGWPETL